MKKVLASLLAAYTLTNGTTVPPVTTSAPGTTSGGSGPAIPPPPPIGVPPVDPVPPVSPPVDPVVPVDPVTPVTPVVPAPVTPAPVTPTTAAPTTPAPTTPAPTTPAPTFNPYCPMPAALASQHGVQSGGIMSSNQGCISPFERAVAFNGILQCSTYACCQCAEIQCGDPFGLACDELVISDSGAVGNQNINVLGDMSSAFGGNSFAGIGGAMNNGAEIRCNGLESCKASRIYGKYVGQLSCSGDMGCSGANIRLEDPGEQLQVQCNGMMSCMNTNLEIIITPNSQAFELQTIEFNGQQAAQGMTITINNQGMGPVLLQKIECMNPTACPNLRVNIIGQVYIETCDLQHMNIQTAGASLLAACQAGNNFGGNFPFPAPGFPQQPQPGFGFPQQPIQPIPQIPISNPGPFQPQPPAQLPPVQQQPPATNPLPPPPVNQQPPAQLPPVQQQPQPGFGGMPGFGMGFGMVDPQQLTCEFGQCMNRAITMTPAHNFQLKCQLPGQCNGMQLTLNVGQDPTNWGNGVSSIDSLTFSAPTNGATININAVAGVMVEVNDIRCEVFGACNNLKINAGHGVDIWNINMDCQQPGACNGCTINGMDCNMVSMQQGNNNGMGFGGFGFQQPGLQQPGFPQQPLPPQWI